MEFVKLKDDDEVIVVKDDDDGTHRLMMAGFYAFISIVGASIGIAFLFYSPIIIRNIAEWLTGF